MQGRIIRAPEIWNEKQDDRQGLFLAGGISGCPQWQAPLAKKLANVIPAVIIDPRRENWDTTNSHLTSVIQSAWEVKHLKKCSHILFWFPKDSICTTALFELGAYLKQNAHLSIGTDPLYPKRFDIEVQVALVQPLLTVWSDLDQMADELINKWAS